jgi:hypothetical protein
MLQINLIPLERRRKDRTPLPRFLIIIGSIIMVLGLLFWDLTTWVNTNNEKGKLAVLKQEVEKKKSSLVDLSKLQDEKKQLEGWKQAADAVKALRVFKWWEVVDDLWYIFGEFPDIWISSFKGQDTAQNPASKASIEATLSFDCKGLGEDPKLMTNFREKLTLDAPEITNIFNRGITTPAEFSKNKLSSGAGGKTISIIEFKIVLERERKTTPTAPPK